LERSRGAAPCVPRDAAPAEAGVGRKDAGASVPLALRGADHGVDHREGDGQVGGARPHWRRAGESAADRHAPAGGPADHLRPGEFVRRQPEEEPPHRGRSVQHLYARRPAAAADRHAGPRVAAGGDAPGKDRGALLRLPGRRLEPVLPHARRAQPRRFALPAAAAAQGSAGAGFITPEGVDGAGKSTHLQFIADAVAAASGRHTIVTREPGGTDLAEQLRRAILEEPMDAMAETLLIFAARAHHVRKVIRPALESGSWVVCDRFVAATYAYQGAGKGVPNELIERLSAPAHPRLLPHRT